MTRLPSQTLRQGRECALGILVAIQQVLVKHLRLEDCWPEILARVGAAIGVQQAAYFASQSVPLQDPQLYAQAYWHAPDCDLPSDQTGKPKPADWCLTPPSLEQLRHGSPLIGPLASFSQGNGPVADIKVLASPLIAHGHCWGVLRCDLPLEADWEPNTLDFVQAVVAAVTLKFSPPAPTVPSEVPPSEPVLPTYGLPAAPTAPGHPDLALTTTATGVMGLTMPSAAIMVPPPLPRITEAACFHALWTQTAMGLSQFDTSHRLIRVNACFCDIVGYSEVELLGRSITDITHPDDLNIHLALGEQLFRGEIPSYSLEKRLVRKDGEVRWVQISVALVRSPVGIPQCDIAIVKDITDRKQTEAKLRAQTRREQAINRVIQTIRQSLLLEAVFSAAMQEISALLDVDFADIAQYIPAENLWRQVACYSSHDEAFPSTLGHIFPDLDNPVTAQLKQMQIVQLTDESFLNLVHPVLGKTLIGARLLVPIPNYQSPDPDVPKVWGRLRLGKHTQPTWSETEVEITQILVDQLAIAIQQSELYCLVHRFNQNLEGQVQARTAELQRVLDFEALLKRITEKVRDSLDERQILQTVVQELGKGLGVKCCDTALYDLEMTQATIAYEYNPIIPPARQTRISMDAYRDLYQQIARKESFQFCWWGTCSVRPSKQNHLVLVCPIVDDQSVLGDLWLMRNPQQNFDALEISLVEQVAAQCAIALRQARLYAAAQVQVQELERLNHLKDDFLSTVSHELRSPMSNIKMATQMLEILLKRVGMLQPEGQAKTKSNLPQLDRYFKILQDECEREISLINDLLDLSRLEAGTEPLSLSTMDLQLWLPHLTEPFHSRMANHQQQFVIQVATDLPPLTTDFGYLSRVMRELMNNACKYTPAHETITLQAKAVAQGIAISVSNSGVDIPRVELSRMFEKFYRIPSNDPWKHGGTGLGLALVKRMVDHLGAVITVAHQDRILQFTVTIPYHR
ncbi:PAS domain S-box protein [Trichothermofontia sp.]